MNVIKISIKIFNDIFTENIINEDNDKYSILKELKPKPNSQISFDDLEFVDDLFEDKTNRVHNEGFEEKEDGHFGERYKKMVATLASYQKMNVKISQKGTIIFREKTIKSCSEALINKTLYTTDDNQKLLYSLFIVYYIISDIMLHETFHYYCDCLRNLLSVSNFSREKEEALAVAYSANEIKKNGNFLKDFLSAIDIQLDDDNEMNKLRKIKSDLDKTYFERFTGLPGGYGDWESYKETDELNKGISEHTNRTSEKKIKDLTRIINVDNKEEGHAIVLGCDIDWYSNWK